MKKLSDSRFSRRGVLVAGAAAAALSMPFIASRAWSQNRSINIGTYTGTQADYIRKSVIPQFEKDYGCRVFQTEGSTLGQIAILRTQKAAPTYTVMFMDDLGVPTAQAEDLIERLPAKDIPAMSKVFEPYVVNDGFGVSFAAVAASIVYNTQSAKPLSSYEDLWSEDLAGRFMLKTPAHTQGALLPIVAAALVTGKPLREAQYDIDKGWEKLAKLKPNVQTIYEDSVIAVLQLAQGQADYAGLDVSKVVLPYTTQGAAVNLCYPKEGAFVVLNCMTLVKNAPNRDLGIAFIDRMLTTDIQKGISEVSMAAPTISGVTLAEGAAKVLPYPETKIKELGLTTLDWSHINKVRSSMIEKTNQIFRGR